MAIYFSGKKIAEKIKKQLKEKVSRLKKKPCLAVILVGKNPASETYVKLKEKAAAEIGIKFKKFIFPSKVSRSRIIKLIGKLNQDKKTHGIIVQLPLPKHLNPDEIVQKIDPKKNVDGFVADSKFISPTHQAILTLLKSVRINLKNKKAVVLSKSKIFAEPLKNLLTKQKIKTEIILFRRGHFFHDREKSDTPILKKFDIIIMALGKPHFLKPSMIKGGTIVIDVGYSRIKDKSVGDVAPECYKKAAFLSPVPGGVGPLTVIYLLKNVIKSVNLK